MLEISVSTPEHVVRIGGERVHGLVDGGSLSKNWTQLGYASTCWLVILLR